MNISRRTALVLSLTSLLGLGGTAAVSGLVLDDAFRQLEQDDARRDVERVRTAVDADLQDLAWTAAQLSDLVAVVFGNTTDGASDQRLAESAALIASIVRAADVDAIALGADGNWTAWSIDQDRLTDGLDGAFVAPPAGMTDAVVASSLPSVDFLEPRSTLLRVEDEAYLAAARPSVPIDGVSVVVAALRLADDDYEAHLAAVTGLVLDAEPDEGPDEGAGAADPSDAWSLRRDGLTGWVASDSLEGDGGPVLRVQVTGDRDVYQQGLVAFLFVVGGTTLLSGLLLAVGLVVMRSTVTRRLDTLSERVRHVLAAGDLAARVGIGGDDELAQLGHEFDLLLADLEHRSSELTRSNVELGAFAGVVSHDLKSPLATFSMNLNLLSRRAEAEGDEKQQTQVARMERAVKTMQDRIEAVLEYSRAGREPKRKVVALDDVARTVLEDVEAHLVETGAHVELQPLPSVRGDRQALGQVFQNLVQNAIKYRRPDVPPRIRIRAEEADGGYAVLVADNGRGFEQEDAERMLQPFQRLANGSDQSGHGIGLATAVRIMAAHDGTLTAFGKPGRGAIMRLWFPKDRVLAPPSPGRASLVGGLKKALTTKQDAPAVAAAPPMEHGEPEDEESRAPPEPSVNAEAAAKTETDRVLEPEAPQPEPEPEPPEPEPAPSAPTPPAPTARVERPPRPHPDEPGRPSRRGTHHTLRGASLTAEERAELEDHLGGPARSQRSSRARRAAQHGPQDGPEPRPADRAR